MSETPLQRVQIDKTFSYEQAIPGHKGFFYEQVKRSKGVAEFNINQIVSGYFSKIGSIFFGSDVSTIRTVIIAATLACFVMGYISNNQYYFQTIAYTQGLIGLFIIAASFSKIGAANIRLLGNIYIYCLNICNVANIGLSHFNDKISYQFIIYFFVTNLFFNTSKSLIFSIALISVLIGVTIYAPSENSSSLSDFYLSYAISAFALAVLMLKRFKTEAQLAKNELQYRLLAENSADIICTHTPSGEFDFVSPSVSALTGYQSSELMGKSALRYIYPEDRPMYESKLIVSGSNIENEAFQYRFQAKDGRYIWLETVVRGLDHGRDNIEGRFLSQTRSFQKHHEYLEQIEQHSNELQSSYKDLEMFAYISSHDMQEPLRMISNYMQLLKRKYSPQLDKDAMEYIDFAVKGASNLQALIKDLLSYSTINKKEITFVPVDMDVLLDDVLSGLQLLMQDKNAKVFISEPMLPLLADKNALTQLVQNLITNGIKYNTSEVPTIRISCIEDAKSVTYCVKDNGIGIDKQYAQQIFEPFRRLHNKHNFPGTGLGLSICRKIIDRLHGRIWVESETGVGSSFYFSIPKSQEE
jgi:PAS domain S-box-containing protein